MIPFAYNLSSRNGSGSGDAGEPYEWLSPFDLCVYGQMIVGCSNIRSLRRGEPLYGGAIEREYGLSVQVSKLALLRIASYGLL